jgi:hypothetical protein
MGYGVGERGGSGSGWEKGCGGAGGCDHRQVLAESIEVEGVGELRGWRSTRHWPLLERSPGIGIKWVC